MPGWWSRPRRPTNRLYRHRQRCLRCNPGAVGLAGPVPHVGDMRTRRSRLAGMGAGSILPGEREDGGEEALAGLEVLVGVAVFPDGDELLIQEAGSDDEGYRRAGWGKLLLGGWWLGWGWPDLIHGAGKIGSLGRDCKVKR